MQDGVIRLHIWVSGVVQGVFYRASMIERARGLAIDGWVRNLADGRVEAVFEGDPGAVGAILAWAHEGPAHAVVECVETAAEAPLGEQGFHVARGAPRS
ncbi:MAG: acylphosphatase [Coriobacteriia bacterium]|nr:acylphosphatase [Coriobacteriia bacterium]